MVSRLGILVFILYCVLSSASEQDLQYNEPRWTSGVDLERLEGYTGAHTLCWEGKWCKPLLRCTPASEVCPPETYTATCIVPFCLEPYVLDDSRRRCKLVSTPTYIPRNDKPCYSDQLLRQFGFVWSGDVSDRPCPSDILLKTEKEECCFFGDIDPICVKYACGPGYDLLGNVCTFNRERYMVSIGQDQ